MTTANTYRAARTVLPRRLPEQRRPADCEQTRPARRPGLLEVLAVALADAAAVDELAGLLHDTSCRCTGYTDRARDTCPDYLDGRYRRWVIDLHYEINATNGRTR